MINITLPDEKSNYVHRIGRVGRAEKMGLAISFVSNVPEKVVFYLMFFLCIKLINFCFVRYGTTVSGANLVVETAGTPD